MRIAIDLGGTNVRVAAVTPEGRFARILSEPCLASGSETEVLEQLYRIIDDLFTPEVDGIGIGVPSVVDTGRGIVYNVVGIPSWKEVHLKDLLEARYHVKVSVDNDCNCFALGVTRFGKGGPHKEAFCVTLGTGVGGSLVVDGHLYRGRNAGAGEIGSIPYLDKDYEYYCSSRFFTGKGTSGKDVAVAAASGEPWALEIMEEFGGHIGRLVQMIMYAYDPAVIIFGGSIAKAFSLFSEPMWRVIKEFPYPKSVENLDLYSTDLDNPGILGAALLCGTSNCHSERSEESRSEES
ncbi:MAG: ROK family protein [Bacteroidales bacterium]|nr:ROK family protein [Bacteroidales bacterium]